MTKRTKRTRRLFSAEFKLEAVQLVLGQNYSVTEAAQAMNVGKSTMDKWVRQLKQEHQGGHYTSRQYRQSIPSVTVAFSNDDGNKKALINKGFVDECGVGGNLFDVLDLLTHLFNQHFQLYP